MNTLSADITREILKSNIRREYRTLSPYAEKSTKGVRLHGEREIIPDKLNIRPVFFHDADRIIHSLAYTRYIDKTQVFSLFENDHITHRGLHVQFVSKIARVIGRFLRLNEDLIEAIALGHDLGHVPYGHEGERFLNAIAQKRGAGCFCHNAQSVRCLMELENHGRGCNLTLQVLDGILSHYGEKVEKSYTPGPAKTWDAFLEEYRKCFMIEDYYKTLRPMTMEGSVVRIADIIAYIGRDIEDAIEVGLVKREDIPEPVTKILGNTNREIINNLIIDIINESYEKKSISFSTVTYTALHKLLVWNYRHIYNNPKKTNQNDKIEYMMNFLFEKYINDLRIQNRRSALFTLFLDNMNADYVKKTKNERIVLDFIAGMTDDFFNNEFRKYIMPVSYGLTVD
ncbi:MAG: HD domain-containing protein [Spirochaetales bacterium]|nr:HD domain-containing protein [Spirochaetales bacterium]